MIRDFQEKEIRKKILSKVNPKVPNKSASHWWGLIYLNNKLVTKVKLPNNHNRIMHKSKSKYIARDLKLSDDQFNRLIECHLKGSDYYKIIEAYL